MESGPGPKEGERVALGHFHESVGESPRREKNFGTSDLRYRWFPKYGRLKLEFVLEQQGAKQQCPEVSVDGGWGAKGATENVHSFVNLLCGQTSSVILHTSLSLLLKQQSSFIMETIYFFSCTMWQI